MPFATTYANSILNYIFGKTSGLTAPSSVYIALSSNDPEADGGTFTELSGGGYSRVLISLRGETYPDVIGSASARSITNTKQVNWSKATAKWLDIKGFAIYDAPTSGNMIYYGKITNAEGKVSVDTGAVALFDPQAFKITIASTDVDA